MNFVPEQNGTHEKTTLVNAFTEIVFLMDPDSAETESLSVVRQSFNDGRMFSMSLRYSANS